MTNHPIEAGLVSVSGVDYAYRHAGRGPLALCVHGFPDTAFGWDPTLSALAGAGFHAVAPFMRGYAPTGVPADGGSLPGWIADLNALHTALAGSAEAVLIGHDWGALAAYGAAAAAPDRWRRVVAGSVPPVAVLGEWLLDYDQVRRFWYQYVFLSASAEAIVAHDDLAFLERLWEEWSPGFDASNVLAAVKAALRDPANLSATLETYRALYDPSRIPATYANELGALFIPHPQPTMYLHGRRDGCVGVEVVAGVEAALPAGSAVEILDDAGHFLQYEQPDKVARLIVDFLTA